jgi:hypothetical protein
VTSSAGARRHHRRPRKRRRSKHDPVLYHPKSRYRYRVSVDFSTSETPTRNGHTPSLLHEHISPPQYQRGRLVTDHDVQRHRFGCIIDAVTTVYAPSICIAIGS